MTKSKDLEDEDQADYGGSWNDLKDKNKAQFRSVYALYLVLHGLYHASPPKHVPLEMNRRIIVNSFDAKPWFNLPKNKKILYTGRISKAALKSSKKEVTNEHRFPRKSWLISRLFDPQSPVSFEEFMRLWWEEQGTYNKTTKDENNQLKQYYKKNPENLGLDGGEKAYADLGIELVDDPSIINEEE